MIEPLEIRVFLSAAFDPKTGLLKVTGTPSADTLQVSQSGGTLTVAQSGAANTTFDATKVKRIEIYGLGGNDTIALRGPSGGDVQQIASLLDGGDGNDTLTGGLRGDTLKGGNGVDTASYVSRNVDLRITLDGVADDGQSGEKDNVLADVENVMGGKARDYIIGSDAANVIDGGAANDTIIGGKGNDSLSGGSGDGNDKLYGNDGNDTLRGGSGNDL